MLTWTKLNWGSMKLTVIKISRGEYNLVDEHGKSYFQYPVSQHEANLQRQNVEVFERMLTHEGINKIVQKFVNAQRWELKDYGGIDQIIRNYCRTLYHSEMREFMRRPSLFYEYLEKEYAKNKAARLASVAEQDKPKTSPMNYVIIEVNELLVKVKYSIVQLPCFPLDVGEYCIEFANNNGTLHVTNAMNGHGYNCKEAFIGKEVIVYTPGFNI